MQKENWLVMQPLNKIQFDIALSDGSHKQGFLRFTRHQQKQYEEVTKNKDADVVEIAEVILNPEPNVVTITRQQIDESLDLDEIKLLMKLWIEKKVVNPTFNQKLDPSFF